MISTIESKAQQLENGYFQTGTGPNQILILGSCRTLPYLSYLKRWNDTNGDKFTIRRIDPCDWAVENVDINSLETDERIQKVIRECDIFIHEHLESYGFVNTERKPPILGDESFPKNIYQFGMNPKMDISIPNFHDRFILEHDYTACGIPTPDDYIQRGEAEVEKFCRVCELSSFPEMASYFRDFWRKVRFFWRPNHTSAVFTMYIFRRMNSRFLNLTLTNEFIEQIKQEDLFKEPHTEVTQRDIDGYRLEWR